MDMDYGVWRSKLLADRYLNGVRGAIPMAREQFDVIMRLIRLNGKKIESFLDLGSGDGILSSVILTGYPEAEGVLLDISEFMISAAKDKLSGFSGNLEFVTYDYGKKDWVYKVKHQSPFDVIISGLSIHHQPDERKKEIYAEIYDLLSPEGIFINLEHVSSPTEWVSALFDDCFIDSLCEMNQSSGVDNPRNRAQIIKDFYNRPDKEANILSPVSVQCEWLKSIGFKDVDCYFKIYEIAIFGGRKR